MPHDHETITASLVTTSLRYLHLRGDVLFFESIPSLATTVFLDPNWLLHAVLGRALSSSDIVSDSQHDGEVLWSDIDVAFEGTGIATQLVVDVLQSAHLCFETSSQQQDRRTFVLPSRLTTQAEMHKVWAPLTARPKPEASGNGLTRFFRRFALGCSASTSVAVTEAAPDPTPAEPEWAGYAGRRLVLASKTAAFPAGFFARVQARLHESFGNWLGLWQDALLAHVHGAQCLCFLRNDQEVDTWVRWMGKQKYNAWNLLSQVCV